MLLLIDNLKEKINLAYINADTILTPELLTSLLKRGIKDVVLYMDFRPFHILNEDTQKYFDLIDNLENFGFIVHQVITPADLLYDHIYNTHTLETENFTIENPDILKFARIFEQKLTEFHAELNKEFKAREEKENKINKKRIIDFNVGEGLNNYPLIPPRLGAFFPKLNAAYQNVRTSKSRKAKIQAKEVFNKLIYTIPQVKHIIPNAKNELTNLFIQTLQSNEEIQARVKSLVIVDYQKVVLPNFIEMVIPVRTFDLVNNNINNVKFSDDNYDLKQIITNKIKQQLKILNDSKVNPFLSSPDEKIKALNKLIQDTENSTEECSLLEIIMAWEKNKTERECTYNDVISTQRNMFFNIMSSDTRTYKLINELKEIIKTQHNVPVYATQNNI